MLYANARSGINYTDQATGIDYRFALKASYVVPIGYVGLPAAKADFQFIRITEPSRFGIPAQHPLQRIYPMISVVHYAMIVDFDAMAEELNGKRGIAFWISNNGSGVCVSVSSEFGRCPLAAIDWHALKPGEPGYDPSRSNEVQYDPIRDPRAKPFWEWRSVIEGGQVWPWTNGRIHGFNGLVNEHAGKDWLDGVPETVTNMYVPGKGQTRQTIVVPKHYGLGTAQQTLGEDDLVNTYSTMLYFPKPAALRTWEKLNKLSSLMTYEEAVARYRQSQSQTGMRDSTYSGTVKTLGAVRGGHHESIQEAAVEITHGNLLTQHIAMPLNDPSLWQQSPSAVIVMWPITPGQAQEMSRPAVPAGQQGFTW